MCILSGVYNTEDIEHYYDGWMKHCVFLVVWSETHTSIPRFLNQRGWRNSDIDRKIQAMEEENPEEDLYATYAMLHTYRKESVPLL